jgi:hypothetical protein
MLGYRLAKKTGVEALWRREENCPLNLIYITFVVEGVEKPGRREGDVWGGGALLLPVPLGPTPPPTPRAYSSPTLSVLLRPLPLGPTPPYTPRPKSPLPLGTTPPPTPSKKFFWKGRPALCVVSCHLRRCRG